jgi:hypothetical protein
MQSPGRIRQRHAVPGFPVGDNSSQKIDRRLFVKHIHPALIVDHVHDQVFQAFICILGPGSGVKGRSMTVKNCSMAGRQFRVAGCFK